MSTVQEQLGIVTDNLPDSLPQDFNDTSLNSSTTEDEFDSAAPNTFEQISRIAPSAVPDNSVFDRDIDMFLTELVIDPVSLPEETTELTGEEFLLDDGVLGFRFHIKEPPTAIQKITGKGLSLAGKGLTLVGEVFSRFNKLVTASPPVQSILGGIEMDAKRLNEGMFLAAQYYSMLNSTGDMDRSEAIRYAQSLVGDIEDFEVYPKDIFINMQTLVSPTEWWKFLQTAKRIITPTSFSEEDKRNIQTFSQNLGGRYYETLTGDNPSNAWKGLVDFSFETLITAPVATAKVIQKAFKGAKKAGEIARIFPATKLTAREIVELKKYYSKWGIAKLAKNPSAARAELKKLTGLSKYATDARLERTLTKTAIDYQRELETLIGRPLRGGVVIGKNKREAARAILDNILSDAKPARKSAEAQKAISRSRKFKKAFTARSGETGEKAARKARWALKGDDFIHDFEVDLSFLTQEMRDELFDVINSLPEWDAQHAASGMWKILDKQLPTRSEVSVLEKAFGVGVLDKIEAMANRQLSVPEMLADLANLPRAIQTSFDMGAPIRQGNFGLKAGYADEWGDAFVKTLKVGVHEEYANVIDELGRVGPQAVLYREAGLDLTTLSRFAKLTAREEQYLSTYAERIPIIGRGVKWSERVHVAFLNQFRMNIFDSTVATWRAEGRALKPKDLKALGEYVNHMTGRGDLKTANRAIAKLFGVFGKKVKDVRIPTTASTVLYSPRFLLSKIQVHTDLFATQSPLVRKMIARDLKNFYYTNVQMLRLAKMGSERFGWTVEDDPVSTDFGKIKVGNIRYDVWGPTAPLMRLMAKVESGVSKSTVTGEIRDISRKAVTMRYLRSKASPAAGLIVDLIEGETFIGNDIDLTTAAGITDVAQQRLVPLVVQDLVDAFRFGDTGFMASAATSSAFFGQGVVSYRPTPFQQAYVKKEKLSQELFGKPIDELDGVERMALLKVATTDPEIAILERQGMFERGDDLGEFIAEENRKSESQIKNKLPKDVRNVIDETFTGIQGVSRKVEFQGIQLLLQREEFVAYKDIVAENITNNIRALQISPSPDTDLLYMDAQQIDEAIRIAIKQSQADIVVRIISE